MSDTTTVLLEDLGFPEAPRWHDDQLWFSDFHDRVVRRAGADGTSDVFLELDDSPSGLGWLPDGDLLVVSMTRRALLRVSAGAVRPHADLAASTRFRANDLVVDAVGRAYVSSFGFDLEGGAPPEPTALLRVDPDGSVHVAARDVVFPNGMVLFPGGHVLVVAETYASRLTAFDVAEDGTLSGRRVFAELPGVAPDGICLDAAGQVWVATARSPQVVRVADGGEVTATVTVGTGSLSYACALGGPAGRTLFVCTAPSWRPGPRAGRIEVVEVDVPAP